MLEGKDCGYGMEELVPIVADLAKTYVSCDSTSITYEKARQLMEAVIYCIRESQGSCVEGLVEGDSGKKQSAEQAYRLGCRILREKVEKTKEQYHRLLPAFCSYGNRCLDDTIRKGIPEFFRWYDIKYDPQNTILTLDYPVLQDLSRYTGADAVYLYIKYVSIEQKFLRRFPKTYIRETLAASSSNAGALIENLCGILWQNVIGHGLLRKSFEDCGFSAEECGKLSEKLAGKGIEEMKRLIWTFAEEFMEAFFDETEEFSWYFRREISGIAVRIHQAVELGTVDRIFVW